MATQDRPAVRLALLLLLGLLPGCGYTLGDGFATDIRTVHVPMFTSESFRRGQGERLTEAVHKQIELRTPYRIVTAGQSADTRLTGHLVAVDKRMLTETRYDDVRELEIAYALEMRWEDLRTGRVLSSRMVPVAGTSGLLATATFAPEVGQSLATAEQGAVDQLAREVVNVMEVPW